jgi:hypothetical protein
MDGPRQALQWTQSPAGTTPAIPVASVQGVNFSGIPPATGRFDASCLIPSLAAE